ncbi:MAG: MerR family transcriptional regulator [Ginsengibacter sp.]
MDQFSISQLAQFSGIKAHTIRVWEQRYDTLKPNRSEGNTRYYDNSQLRRLLNIVSLADYGYKVSELSVMQDKELFELIAEKSNQTENESAAYFIFQLIAAGVSYDEVYFDKIFSHCLIRFGLKDTYLKVIYPTLARIGLMWTRGILPPAQEHFLSNLFRQKLFTAIDALPPAKSDADSWLLFLPENEFHEIGLLFAHYLISLAGHQVIYLGSNVPYQSFSELTKEIPVDNILLFLVHNYADEELTQYLTDITTQFSGKRIFVACQQQISKKIQIKREINWLTSVMDLEQIL